VHLWYHLPNPFSESGCAAREGSNTSVGFKAVISYEKCREYRRQYKHCATDWATKVSWSDCRNVSAKGFRPPVGPTQPPVQWLPWTFSQRQSGRTLTTALYLVPRLRTSGAILLSPYAFMVCTGTNLSWILSYNYRKAGGTDELRPSQTCRITCLRWMRIMPVELPYLDNRSTYGKGTW